MVLKRLLLNFCCQLHKKGCRHVNLSQFKFSDAHPGFLFNFFCKTMYTEVTERIQCYNARTVHTNI